MKKRLILFFAMLAVGLALFINIILQTGIEAIWTTLRQFSFLFFLIYIFLSTINFCLYTLRWKLILRALLKNRHSFFDLFLHRMAAFAVSYITPTAQTGGEPLRILLLHKDGINVSTATSSVIIDKALEFATLMMFIAIGILLALLDGSLPTESRIFFGFILVAFVALVFWFYYASLKNIGFFSSLLRFFHLHKLNKLEQTIEKIIKIEKQMHEFYKQNAKTFVVLIIISVFIISFQLLEHYLLALFLGVKMTFFQTFLVSTIPYLAAILPIPGSLGVLESGHAATFLLLGVNINAFVLVFIIRLRDFAFILLGLIHASKEGWKLLKEELFNKE